jgi:hypothetical protein
MTEPFDNTPDAPRRRSWLPALAAAGTVGLGTYAAMRRGGGGPRFRRVVDVANQGPNTTLSDRLLTPLVDPKTRNLSPWNKFKLWMREGDNSIPVALDKRERPYVPGTGGGRLQVDRNDLLYGRPIAWGTDGSKIIRGGRDLEGSAEVQRALHRLSSRGKGFEAHVLQRYAPDAVPQSLPSLAPYLKRTGGSADKRLAAIKELQARLQQEMGGRDFLLKPVSGFQSSGHLPSGREQWATHVRKYMEHMANPAKARALRKAEAASSTDLTNYLKKHKLYRGRVLADALRNPTTVMAQKEVPNVMNEWRVHAAGGRVSPWTISNRYTSGPHADLRNLLTAPRRDLQQMMEQTLARLPAKYRRGTYGADILQYRKPDGSMGYKIIELNPTEPATRLTPGAASGFLDSARAPWMPHFQHKAITGQHTRALSALGGLGAGGAAGLLGRAATPVQNANADER